MATAKKASASGARKASGAKKAATASSGGKAKKAPAKKTPAKKAAPAAAGAKASAPAKKTDGKSTATKKAPASKATRKAASPYGKRFVNEMKAALESERIKYLHSAEEYRAEADALIEGREPGDVQFDEESGEGDTLAVERERDLALSAQARAAVDQIDAALARIEAGTYGICVMSGEPIPEERLRAIPWAAERVEYKVGGLGRR